MVWCQYVWEATTGNEVEWSDDDDGHQETLHVDDWLDHNATEIDFMWGIVRAYAHDAMKDTCPGMTREALGRFSFEPYQYDERSFDAAHWLDTNGEAVGDLWRRLRLHFLHRAGYEEFAHFCYANRK